MLLIGPYEPAPPPQFAFALAIQAADLQGSWGRCSLLANYIAEYIAYQFAERERAENLISTVANELLEAVVLLSPPEGELELSCRQYPDRLRLDLSHRLRPELADEYAEFLGYLSGAGGEQYLDQLRQPDRPAPAFNQLGLLMIAYDFRAQIAARQESPDAPIAIAVSIPTREIAA